MNYLIGQAEIGPKSAVLTELQNVEDEYELLKGVSRANNFPKNATFRMSNDFPEGVNMEDFLSNHEKLLVVSVKVKNILESEKISQMEYLPIVILDHNGQKVKEEYFIAHTVGLEDCIDTEKTVAVVHPMNAAKFIEVKKLVIDESKISKGRKLFRMNRYSGIAIFERSLAELIQKEKCTGISFREIADWRGV